MNLSWRIINCKTEYLSKKILLWIWYMKGVLYFELLKSATSQCYQQLMRLSDEIGRK